MEANKRLQINRGKRGLLKLVNKEQVAILIKTQFIIKFFLLLIPCQKGPYVLVLNIFSIYALKVGQKC